MLPISETFRLVSTFLFPYCIVLYRRPRNCKSTSTLPTSRLAATPPRLLSNGAHRRCTQVSRSFLCGRTQKAGRNVLPLITDNESNIDVILDRLTSSPIPPFVVVVVAAAWTAASCRRRNINIYHKITFLATAHFITHIAAIFTQDTRMNYYVYLERAPIKRDRASRVGYIDRTCRQLSLKRNLFRNISEYRDMSCFFFFTAISQPCVC